MNDKYPLALPENTVLAGQYIIEKVLGQGGFGITYAAWDHKSDHRVAIKEFFPDSLATRQNLTVVPFTGEREESFNYGKECFLQEAETLARFIGNENIVRIYSYFEEYGTAFFVMEFIEGTSFDVYLKERGGRISFEEAANILIPIMDALAVVHANGIVHRDVTPDNIYITKDGVVKLLDFGAARYSLGDKSRSLDVVLKHGFAPKEQYARHGRQGPFTDVYALGATFYFALTGKRPPDSVERMDVDELIPPSALGVQISKDEESAILLALKVREAERFQSMGAFKGALMSLSSRIPAEVRQMSQGQYPREAQPAGTVKDAATAAKAAASATADAAKAAAGAAVAGLDKLGGAIVGTGEKIQNALKEQSEVSAQKKRERDEKAAQKRAEKEAFEAQKKAEREAAEAQRQAENQRTEMQKKAAEPKTEIKSRKPEEKSDAEKDANELFDDFKRIREKREKNKKMIVPAVVLVLAVIGILIFIVTPRVRYRSAEKALQSGNYDEAIAGFTQLGNFWDSQTQIKKAKYLKADKLLAAGAYDDAIVLYTELGAYYESQELLNEARLGKAGVLVAEGNYDEANEILAQMEEDENVRELKNEITFERAVDLYETGDYDTAQVSFQRLNNEGYSKDETELYLQKCSYEMGKESLENGSYAVAIQYLKDLDYEDAQDLLLEAKWGYIQAHYNNTDSTTCTYVKDLIAGGYPGAQNTYDKLYSWKVEILGFNDDRGSSSYVKQVSVDGSWVCHARLTGGEPFASTTITYAVVGVTGISKYGGECEELKKAGDTCALSYSYTNGTGPEGTFTFYFYQGDKELARGSVQLVK
ncbi:MAG: protein kinase [Lachnospiraceae bacterium]|nr:protein kinase [Lachnospiraceae bacterium]